MSLIQQPRRSDKEPVQHPIPPSLERYATWISEDIHVDRFTVGRDTKLATRRTNSEDDLVSSGSRRAQQWQANESHGVSRFVDARFVDARLQSLQTRLALIHAPHGTQPREVESVGFVKPPKDQTQQYRPRRNIRAVWEWWMMAPAVLPRWCRGGITFHHRVRSCGEQIDFHGTQTPSWRIFVELIALHIWLPDPHMCCMALGQAQVSTIALHQVSPTRESNCLQASLHTFLSSKSRR